MPEDPNLKIRTVPLPTIDRPAECSTPYAELDVTTNFSFLEGASHADELVIRAAEFGYRAIAITDRNTLAGIVRMHQVAKLVRLPLIIGARLTFTDAPDVLAWVTNRTAYARLCRLLTLGRRRAEKGTCELHLSDLLENTVGLLLAVVPRDSAEPSWTDCIPSLKDVARKRIWLAASSFHGPRDRQRLQDLNQISKTFRVPLVATNNVHYHDPDRRALQDVLTCIRHGCTIHNAGYRLFPNSERHLKTPEQMHQLFAECPEAIHNTVEIAQQCTFSLDELRYEYPDELVPEARTSIDYLSQLTWAGATIRYPDGIPEKVQRQVDHELQLIQELHFEPYFLTVHDLVAFARSRGILCQGRGSAANSAVCYCLGVTSVDPSRIDLLFERFISAARSEPPDIDIDFEHERREEVLQYIYSKYGRERSGMTATVITYRPRSAVRDVAKAMGMSQDMQEHMASKLDWWETKTLTDAHLRQMGLDPADRTVRLVIELTSQLLGFPRHLSQHTGGMVMTRGPLCELVPIENASMEDRTVIQWDKEDIEELGILKVDCLALGMLTCIRKSLALINERRPVGQPALELHTIPAEDPAVYEMCSNADTIGVFQIESRAQMSMLPRLRPKEFYDLVIEVAIVRPGPIQGDMVHPYLRRRQGLEPVEFPKDELRQVLGKTLGVPLFQEQAMRIAIECAGFAPDEADRLRGAVTGFRRYGDINSFQQKFVGGMVARGYQRDFAERCFAQLQGFSTYGFPESHAASFALLVYASAWIKCHHPAVFACGLLNSQPMGFYAPAQIVRDAKDHGVEVRPVDINHSRWDCTLEGDDRGPALRLGYRQVKGMRIDFADRIAQARHAREFQSIDDLCWRTKLPRHVIQRLAQADAFGSLELCRRESLWQALAHHDVIDPLFRDVNTPEPASNLPAMPIAREVALDYNTTGMSLKCHPVSLLRSRLAERNVVTSAQLADLPAGRWVKVAGLVLIRQRPGTAKGIIFITLEDETGVVNLVVMPDIYDRYRTAARHAALLQADGYVERQGQVIHVKVKRAHDLSDWLSGSTPKSRDFH